MTRKPSHIDRAAGPAAAAAAPTRRAVGQGLLALLGIGAVLPASAWSATPSWHVAYPGTTTEDEAQEFLEQIAVQFGPTVTKDLAVRRYNDLPTVVYNRGESSVARDKARGAQVAARHNQILQHAFDEKRTFAVLVSDASLQAVFNIRYGDTSTLSVAQGRWDDVVRMLGTGVAKALVIEQRPDGTHQLVYRRLGDKASTTSVAAHHADLLRKTGLPATATVDSYFPIVADGSTVGTKTTPKVGAAPPPLAEPRSTKVTLQPGSSALEAAIETHVKNLRATGQVSSLESTAWIVYDLHSDTSLASINVDRAMQAASMIKPWIALAFFHKVQQGRIAYGPVSTEKMRRMIQISDNDATNWMIDQTGGVREVQSILRTHYAALSDTVRIVESIPAGGRTYKNRASVAAHARFLRALWLDRLPRSAELKRVMNLPGSDRLYRNVPEIPVGTAVYNKTGTTGMCCGDMGILVARTPSGRTRPYILAGVIERSQRTSAYTSWQRGRSNVIRSVSGLVYRWMKQQHGLV